MEIQIGTSQGDAGRAAALKLERSRVVRFARTPRVAAVALAIAGAAILGGCGGGGTTINTPQGKIHVSGTPGSGGSYTFKGPHGSGQVSASSTQLPSGFPSSVPLPDGYKVLGSYGTTSSGSSGWEVYLGVKGPPSAAASSYKQKLSSAGFTITSEESSSSGGAGETSVVMAKNGGWSVDATITASSSGSSSSSSLPQGDVTMMLIVGSSKSSGS
ncbi:MAG: hypothetical protein ACYDEY_00580 [Acidimicrobiales bacterium]